MSNLYKFNQDTQIDEFGVDTNCLDKNFTIIRERELYGIATQAGELSSIIAAARAARNTKVGIASAEALADLATIVNTNGDTCSDIEFVLTNDIDLSEYSNWTSIGTSSNKFQGTFDGQGHVISNLTRVDDTIRDCFGLFGYINNATIKNLGRDPSLQDM